MSCLVSGFRLSYFNDLGDFAIAVVAVSKNSQGWFNFVPQVLYLLNLFHHELGMPVP